MNNDAERRQVIAFAREAAANALERVGRGWALMGMAAFTASERMRRKARAR